MPHTQHKTLTRIFAISLLMLFFFSCKKETALKNTSLAKVVTFQVQKDSNFVNLNLATTSAKQVSNSHLVSDIIAKQAINGLNLPAARQILDTLAVPNNVNPSYYIFNYVGGGYVIIPADKRVEPILSYSNTGYFPHSGALPVALANWLTVNHNNMQLLRKDTALKVPASVAGLWAELTPANTSGNKVLDNMDNKHPACQPTYSSTTIGALLKTTWGQWDPYNLLCKADADPHSNGYSPTGCVATAMAQIMYYWKTPATYNWGIMPLNSLSLGYDSYLINYPGNQDVAQLMLDVGKSVGMAYGAIESNASDSNIPGTLKNNFGYSSANWGPYDVNTVMANLNAGEPVVLSGANNVTYTWFLGLWITNTVYSNGHAWVCDGYQQINTTECPTYNPYTGDIITSGGLTTYLFLDMNWGWGDIPNNCNGWYNYNQWIVTPDGTTYNWQYDQNMTYNIHP